MKKIIILILVGLLVYINTLPNGFVWDDEEQIVNNQLVHSIKNLPSFFKGSTFNPGGATIFGGLYYKPLMTTTFSLIYSIFGPKPVFFHLFQVFFHLANSVLVYLLLNSFFLALIFLIHPINSEAVVYISGLQDILFFFFGMLATLLVIRAKKLSATKTTVFALLLLLSLLSKETGGLFLAIILVYLVIFQKPKIINFLFSAFLAMGIYAFLRFGLARVYFRSHGLSPITRMNLSQRLLSIPKIIFFYLKTFVFPKDLAISQHWVVRSTNLTDFWLPLMVVVVFFGCLITLGLSLRRHSHVYILYLFFFFWFVAGLGFHLQIFPLDMTVADRWFYLPMVGLLGMLGISLKELKVKSAKLKVLGFCVAVLIIAILSMRTIARTFGWRNGLTLYSHDIKISQDSFDLENNLGVELFRIGKIEEAAPHFENSIKLAPYWWTSYNNLGAYFERKGDLEKAGELYQKAIDNGNYYLAYENLAFIVLKTEKPVQAISTIEKFIQVLPYNQRLLTALTLAYYQDKQWEKAGNIAQKVYSLFPTIQNKNLLQVISNRQEIKF